MKRISTIAMFIAVGTAAHAQGLEQKFSLGGATNEVWRGQMLTDGFVINPALTFGSGTGLQFRAWGSIDMEDKGSDEWRFTAWQDFNAVAFGGSIGIEHFARELGFADTTEVFASASMRWPVAVTFSLHRDIDAVEGTYARASMGAGIPTIGAAGASFGLNWKAWVGYADEKFGAYYYGFNDAGLADAGFRLQADFGLVVGKLEVWAQATTLLNPDYLMTNGDRGAITVGASWSMRF